ncbi:MAG: hypothetical protein IKZ07_07855 [Akkermansia sp.]|nr:hypothetical protein [Akkermansia sp.]
MKLLTTRFFSRAAAAIVAAAAVFCSCQQLGPRIVNDIDLTRAKIAPNLLQLGARNWVVVADPACPLPAGTGIVSITVPANTVDSFREVLDLLEIEGAVVPRIWISHELSAISEERAPGITEHRENLEKLLLGRFHYAVNSRVIDMQLNQAAKDFRILYIRTSTRLPYSSIAIELDSGYWNSDAETELQERLQKFQPQYYLPPSPPLRENATTTNDASGLITA